MTRRVVLAGLVGVLCGGCRPGGANLSEPIGVRVWTAPAGEPDVPGLDSGHCYYVGKLLLVWTSAGPGGGGNTVSDRGGVGGVGRATFRNNKVVDFSFRLPDEAAGTAVVDQSEYDLARGRVLLVRHDGEKAVVKQVGMDLSGFNALAADFAAVGRADPAIKAFFDAGR